MSEIRLTCGGCSKRYRLPAGAAGYFRCRKCDLVMAIPVAEPDPAQPDQGEAIPVVPMTPVQPTSPVQSVTPVQPVTPIHATPHQAPHHSPGVPANYMNVQPAAMPYGYGHVKKQVVLQPPDIAAIAVGAMMILGGVLVVLLQLSGRAGDASH